MEYKLGLNKKKEEIVQCNRMSVVVGAGCVFTNGKLILAGYQARKRIPMITGLGGKREGNEDPIYTAWRETLEELFEVEKISTNSIEYCLEKQPDKILESKGYIQYVFSFQVLEDILEKCREESLVSRLYETFPLTLQELLLNRKSETKEAEISQLCLLPMEGQTIAKHFMKDIKMIRGEDICLITSDDD